MSEDIKNFTDRTMELINKDALVSEIEKLTKKYSEVPTRNPYEDGLKDGRLIGYKDTLYKINSLEVKDVDIEKEIKEEYLKQRCYGGRDNMLVILNELNFNRIAKHFFELGLKTTIQENIFQ